jgi:PAS domain S-box-containing protein
MNKNKWLRAGRHLGRRIWRWLTLPAGWQIAPGRLRQAQLLLALLTTLVPLAIGTTLFVVIVYPDNPDYMGWDLVLMVLVTLALVAAYALNRANHYTPAALITVGSLSLAVFAMVLPVEQTSDVNLFIYLIIPILLSSVLLTEHTTLLLGTLFISGMLLTQALYPQVTLHDNWVLYVFTILILVVLTSRHLKQAERDRREAIHQSEAKYRQLVEHASVLIAVTANDRISYINPAGLRLLGAPDQDTLSGQPLTHLLDTDTLASAQAMIDDARRSNHSPPPLEVTCTRLDGQVITLEATAIPTTYLGQPAVQIVARDITPLRRAEAHNRALLDAIPDLIFQLDRNGTFLSYKDPGMGLHTTPEAFMGRTIYAVLPGLAEEAMTHAHAALDTGEVQQFEYQLPLGDTLHDYEARIVASGPDDVVTIVRDVTEQKRAEEALRQSTEKFSKIFHTSPDAMAINRLDDGMYLEINQGFTDLTGYTPEDVLGKTTLDLRQWATPGQPRQFVADLREHHAMQELEATFRLKDGSLAVGQISARLLEIGGEPCVLSITRDITKRKHAEQALLESRARNTAILDAIPDMIFRIDRSGMFLDALLKGTEELLVGPGDTPRGQTVEERVPSPQAQTILSSIRRTLETGQTQVFEYQLDVRAGPRDFEARMVVSGPDEVLMIVRDITERKRAEQVLHRRDVILAALARISEDLLRSSDLDAILPGVLARLGQAAHVSRAYIFRHHVTPDDVKRISLRYEWHTPDIPAKLNYPTGQNFAYETPVAGRLIARLRNGEPLYGLADDFPADIGEFLIDQHVKAVLAVPIFSGDEWWGFLGFDDCETERTWLAAEIEALRNVAGALGAAIARQHTATAEREQRHMAEALRDIATTLNRTLDPDEVLERILATIGRVVPHDAANIVLLDESGVQRILRSRGYVGRTSKLDTLDENLSVVFTNEKLLAVLDSQPGYLVHDTHTDPLWIPRESDAWIRSHLSMAIHFEGDIIGVLNLDSAELDAFSWSDAERLQAFADQAAVAIRNAQVFAAERDQRALAEALHDSAAAITSTLNLDDVLERILATIGRVVPHDAANIMLLGESGVQRIVRSQSYLALSSSPATLDEDLNAVFTNCQSPTKLYSGLGYLVDDAHTDPAWFTREADAWIRSHLGVGIRFEGELIGVLNLDSAHPGTFNWDDARRLQSFANQAAIAIQNAQLYDELEQRVAARTTDLSVRNAVAETLSSSLDTTEMLDGVLHTTVQRLGVLGGAIYLLDPESESLGLAAHEGVTPATLRLVTGIAPGSTDLGQLDLPEGDAVPDIPRQTGVSAVLSVPIWQQDQMQGVIWLVHDEPRPWRSEETRMLEIIGRQIGVALANARLYTDAVRGEAHLRTILESVVDGILVFDADATLTLMNPAARALFAFYPNEAGGPPQAAHYLWEWLLAQTPGDAPPASIEFELPAESLFSRENQRVLVQCAEQDCPLADRDVPGWPCWLHPASGSVDAAQCPVYRSIPRRTIQAHSASVRDADGTVLGTVFAFNDVTHYRELDTLKDRFVSTVSHELRTPLSAMLLQISTLHKYYAGLDASTHQKMIVEIYQQTKVLRELIEDILQLSRFDADRAVLEREAVDLAAACDEVLTSLRPVIHDKNIQVTVENPDHLPAVWGDRAQLGRALRNLLSNAVKYTPVGGTVSVRLARTAQDVQVVVQDTGIGIAPEEQAYVFDRFYRTQGASQIAGGTGLGLAITREIMDLHGGWVELQSTPGEGSTFTLHLPLPSPA